MIQRSNNRQTQDTAPSLPSILETTKRPGPKTNPLVPVDERPIPVQEFRTQCLQCGKFVVMRCRRTVEDRRYVTCPGCGAEHCVYPDSQMHRLVRCSE